MGMLNMHKHDRHILASQQLTKMEEEIRPEYEKHFGIVGRPPKRHSHEDNKGKKESTEIWHK